VFLDFALRSGFEGCGAAGCEGEVGEDCDDCLFMRRAAAEGMERIPKLSRLNERLVAAFGELFTPLARDFPFVFPLALDASGLRACGAAERRYRLRAWAMIYRHLLEKARMKAASAKAAETQERNG
jgi:hypothetical protein